MGDIFDVDLRRHITNTFRGRIEHQIQPHLALSFLLKLLLHLQVVFFGALPRVDRLSTVGLNLRIDLIVDHFLESATKRTFLDIAWAA